MKTEESTEKSLDADDDSNDDDQGLFAAILAGLTKSLVYGLKSIPRTLVKASLHKQAFLTLGRRTLVGNTVVAYRYDGKKVVAPKTLTIGRRAREFAKGSLLGFVVFTVYDILMHNEDHRQDKQNEAMIISNCNAVLTSDMKLVWMHSAVRPNDNDAPLIAHFGAGCVSGLAFSVVQDAWDFARRGSKKGYERSYQKMNSDFLVRRLIHHSLGYATLFGSYEFFRRFLVEEIQNYLLSGHPSVPGVLHLGEQWRLVHATTETASGVRQLDMTAVPTLTAFLAGGLAGQAHFITDHYTRTWKLRAIRQQKQRVTPQLPPLMLMRHMLGSFLPTALCFVAFQYGAEFYDRVLDGDDQQQGAYPFPETKKHTDFVH